MPSFAQLKPAEQRAQIVDFLFGDAPSRSRRATTRSPNLGQLHAHGLQPVPRSRTAIPRCEPPWGTLNAIDLNTGTIAWSVPLGELPELTAQGDPADRHRELRRAHRHRGRARVRRGHEGREVPRVRYDNGKLLWESSLPAGGYATPAIYSVKGRQFVVIAAGGGKMGTKSGDAYVAYALP